MTAHSTGRAPAAGPASSPTAVTDRRPADPSKRRRINPAEPTEWQRRTYSFGRYAVIAIPVFALIAGLLPRSSAAFSLDPSVYAHYLATGRWTVRESVATIGLAVTGVLSIVGLASLLFRGRARAYALAGLVAGLAGSAGMLMSVGSMVIRQDRLRSAFVHGDWSQLAFNARTTGAGTATLAAGGAVLLTLGWILLGVAVLRTSGMNRADGPLLIICTPLIFLGGFVLHVLPTMGSFLLLAAGLGIVFTASRISVIGEETWSQRRRRPPIALTGPIANAPVAAESATASAAESDANDPLDRAGGLAGSLGLARPRLFPEHQVASAAIYHAPTTSAAEAGDTPDGLTTVPATPEPSAPETATSEPATPEPATPGPARPEPAAAPASEPVAESNGNRAPANHAASNGASPSRDDARDGSIRNGNGPHAQDGSGQNGGAQNGGAQNGGAQNGGAQNGKPASDGGPPATKSLRDLLRGARGAAAAWPTYRSRSGSTNGGPARNDGGRAGDPAGANHRNGGRPDSGAGKGTNRSSAAGRSSGSSASNGGPRSGVSKDSASKTKRRPTKPSGRSDTGRTKQPPPDPAPGEPDPSTGPPTARE